MNAEQRAARDAFAELLENTARADAVYNGLREAHGGKVISTDIARYLDVRYRDTPEGHRRDLVPGWDLAWRYAQSRLEREIEHRGGREIIGFMAGGWGAGKTHALEGTGAALSELAWDGTLKDYGWAREMIELSLGCGWCAQIVYVFRDVELALYGAVERARTEGRGVPLRELPSNHRAVQRTILRLMRRYRTERRVAFVLLHNTGIRGSFGKSLDVSERETLLERVRSITLEGMKSTTPKPRAKLKRSTRRAAKAAAVPERSLVRPWAKKSALAFLTALSSVPVKKLRHPVSRD